MRILTIEEVREVLYRTIPYEAHPAERIILFTAINELEELRKTRKETLYGNHRRCTLCGAAEGTPCVGRMHSDSSQ